MSDELSGSGGTYSYKTEYDENKPEITGYNVYKRNMDTQRPPYDCGDILSNAISLIATRGYDYDNQATSERSMGKTVDAFNVITGHDLTEAEGWLFMTLLKNVRFFTGKTFHQDSGEDGVAYAALMVEAKAKEV